MFSLYSDGLTRKTCGYGMVNALIIFIENIFDDMLELTLNTQRIWHILCIYALKWTPNNWILSQFFRRSWWKCDYFALKKTVYFCISKIQCNLQHSRFIPTPCACYDYANNYFHLAIYSFFYAIRSFSLLFSHSLSHFGSIFSLSLRSLPIVELSE